MRTVRVESYNCHEVFFTGIDFRVGARARVRVRAHLSKGFTDPQI